jgi:DNA-binding transcriptional MerR regulator
MAIDTLKVAKRLREAGFTEPQAEAVIAAVQDGTEGADLATKGDLNGARTALKVEIAQLRAELKTEIAELRAELKAEIADLRSELRQAELRLEAKIEDQGGYSESHLRLDPRHARREYRRDRGSHVRGRKARRTLRARSIKRPRAGSRQMQGCADEVIE